MPDQYLISNTRTWQTDLLTTSKKINIHCLLPTSKKINTHCLLPTSKKINTHCLLPTTKKINIHCLLPTSKKINIHCLLPTSKKINIHCLLPTSKKFLTPYPQTHTRSLSASKLCLPPEVQTWVNLSHHSSSIYTIDLCDKKLHGWNNF